MTTIANTFEGGTDGVTITTGNSDDGASGTAFSAINVSGTQEYDTAVALDTGTVSAKLIAVTGATDVPYIVWNTGAWTPSNPTWFRGYFRLSALPTDSFQVIQFRNSAGAAGGDGLRVNTDGTLSLLSGFTMRYTSTLTMSVDTWYRIEVKVTSSTTAGHMEARIFEGANVHGATPDETIGSATDNWDIGDNTGTGGFAFGICDNAGTDGLALWIDDVAIGDVDWLGATGAAGDTTDPVAVVSHTSTAATYNGAGELTAAVFTVTAASSTDNVGVTGYSWSDNSAGGSFSSTTVAAPTWTPPDLDGPWTLTCTVSDAASNTNAAGVVVDTDFGSGGGSPVAGVAIAASGDAIA